MLTQTNILAAYLYLHLADSMPEPVLDSQGQIDVVADDAAIQAWSQSFDSFEIDTDALHEFIVQTQQLLVDLEALELDPQEPAPPQYMTLFYDAAKATFNQDKSMIRTYFMWLYLVVYQRPEGTRWGDMVDIYGVNNFVALVRRRFGELLHDT